MSKFWALTAFAGLAVGLSPGHAGAQWFGVFVPNQGPSWTQQQVFQQSQVAAQTALTNRGAGFSPYSGNPNSYLEHSRRARFELQERYDVASRQPLPQRAVRSYATASQSAAPRPAPRAMAPAGKGAAPAAQSSPLAGFFKQDEELVWPADAPVEGDLRPRRDASDGASRAVLREYKAQGLAQVATVAEARAKLLDYGRPALQLVRANASPRVADTFHAFLLALYDALEQAALRPKSAGS